MTKIHVCPLDALDETLAHSEAAALVTLLGPDHASEPPNGFSGHHLSLLFHDIAAPRDGYTPPRAQDVSRLIEFVGSNRHRTMVLHCWMGVSRAPAAAIIACAALRPDLSADAIANHLRAVAPFATPNALMVSLADEQLGRSGTLIRAVQEIGRGADTSRGIAFEIDPHAITERASAS